MPVMVLTGSGFRLKEICPPSPERSGRQGRLRHIDRNTSPGEKPTISEIKHYLWRGRRK